MGRFEDVGMVGETINLENLGGSKTTRAMIPTLKLNLTHLQQEEQLGHLTTERPDLHTTDHDMRNSYDLEYGSTILKTAQNENPQNYYNVQTSLLQSALVNTEQAWRNTSAATSVKQGGVPNIAEETRRIEK